MMRIQHQFSCSVIALGRAISAIGLAYLLSIPVVHAVEVGIGTTAAESTHPIFRLVDWLNTHQQLHDVEFQGKDTIKEDEMESKSIRINPKLKIYNTASPELPPIWSFMATEPIQEGEILTQIPWKYIIDGSVPQKCEEDKHCDEYEEGQYDKIESTTVNSILPSHCQTVQKLVHTITSITTGNQQTTMITVDPYLHYLRSSVPRLPSAWSSSGRAILLEILGGTESQSSPPGGIVTFLEDEMLACQGLWEDGFEIGTNHPPDDDDEGSISADVPFPAATRLWKWAAAIVQQKSHYNLMVPLWDLYTHRNGRYHNVRTEVSPGIVHTVRARRLIMEGETLHASFDFCDDKILLSDDTMTKGDDDDETEKDDALRENPCSYMRAAVTQGYGTPELFRDYGIIEDFPQRWSYHPGAVELEDGEDKWTYSPEQVTFTLELATEHQAGDEVEEEEENEAIIQNSSNIRIAWSDDLLFDNRGRNYVRRIFRRELRRLYRFQNVRFDFNRTESAVEEIPQEEWCSITNYYSSIVRALKIAISSLINDASEVVETVGPSSVAAGACGNKTSSNEGSCPADDIDWNTVHYDDLKDEEDHTNYIFPNCPTTQLVEFYEYQDLEVFQTNYQKLTFLSRGRDRDLCMNIENTLQICSNYRPHYHEFFVHFPARYMEKVERVIFIGGGDSMLLHEVLKYPELQKVVGLELDQQVTRKSFKYFQSQPHFDNDRVEWWYGDATKSLPLLPKEYWGSFDLVLVDLSETVMSMTVTGTLDIFSALSLLLKPEGIMVKNEPYIDQFSDFFDHTIQLFYGSPKICTQVLVMGSNKVDFLHSPVQNHPTVQTLLFENMQHPSDRYKLLHDYRKNNATQQGKCSEHTTNDQDYVMHGRKAGVLEVVDLDSVPVSQFDISRLESNIYKALRSEKLNPISTIRQDSSIQRGSDILVVLKEGFVVVRPWPEYNYIALDIQLWGAFSNLSSVRSKLVEAISGNDISLASSLPVSSYRIVTGGMFGSHTWETDKESIGIQMRQTRDCETPQPAMEEGESADASKVILTKVALEATFTSVTNLLPRNNLVVVVACGLDDDGSCLSIETLSKHPKVGRVIPVWACPDVVLAGIATAITTSENEPSDEDDVDVHSKMYECERSIVSQLNDIFGVEKDDDDEGSLLELDMFVLDPSVPYSMARIYSSVLGFFNNRDDWMAKEHVLLVPNPLIDLTDTDGATDDENLKDPSVGVIKELKDLNWRRNFLERYRKEYHRVPLFRAELMVRRRMDKVSSSSSPLTSSSSFESSIPWLDVGILSSSDRHFFYNLTILEASFQYELDIAIGRSNNSTRMLVSVERVTGGLHYYDTDNERDVTLDNRMYYPESYNKTSAIKQYQNQRPLARHSIFQYELLSSSSSSSSTRSSTATTEHNVTTTASTTTMPTWKQLEEILLLSMDAVRYTPSTIERYDNAGLIGDGAILAAAFTVASSTSSITLDDAISRHTHTHTHHHTHRHDNHNMVIMIWDGRIQVDVHLFSSSDMEGTIADQFATIFEQLSQLSLRLRDDQPRGYGRVVNFETDIVSQS